MRARRIKLLWLYWHQIDVSARMCMLLVKNDFHNEEKKKSDWTFLYLRRQPQPPRFLLSFSRDHCSAIERKRKIDRQKRQLPLYYQTDLCIEFSNRLIIKNPSSSIFTRLPSLSLDFLSFVHRCTLEEKENSALALVSASPSLRIK